MSLGVNAALADGVGHAINSQHISGNAVIDGVGLGVFHHRLERLAHDVLQLLVDHGLLPEVSLAVLHPFEVGGGDAAGVGQNVGHNENALVGENVVCRRGGRSVGAFDENAGLDLVGIAAGDLVLGGGGNQHVAVGQHQLGGIVLFRSREAVNHAVVLAIVPQRLDINALAVVEAAADFHDANDF